MPLNGLPCYCRYINVQVQLQPNYTKTLCLCSLCRFHVQTIQPSTSCLTGLDHTKSGPTVPSSPQTMTRHRRATASTEDRPTTRVTVTLCDTTMPHDMATMCVLATTVTATQGTSTPRDRGTVITGTATTGTVTPMTTQHGILGGRVPLTQH